MPRTPENIIPGSKLAEFIKHLKLKQNDLAKELKVSASNIARYSTGRTPTPVEVIDHLYKKYSLNLDWWYTGNGPKTKANDKPKKSVVTDLGQLMERMDAMEIKLREQDKKILTLTRELHAIKGNRQTH
jgi:transcriptional regulator with XRE-family HTH domain